MTECPAREQLALLLAERLGGPEAERVEAHVQSCARCQAALEDLCGRSPTSPGALAVGPEPRSAFLRRLRGASPDAAADPGRPAGAAPTAPPPGSAVAGAAAEGWPEVPGYEILGELGRGGMGVVYKARQLVMNRQVVIKVISKALLDHPDALERFRREVHAAAQLSHPNIVYAYDAEKAGDTHFLVMEFVPGQSLDEVLRKKGPLPVAHACHYARQAALGLQHAFECGMVHRDIKPANLMLTPKGQVKILDFGLAKIASERGPGKRLTASGAYMGTPEYSAPEQATDARKADIRADLYSLGCTLYCLLAGHPPFREETAVLTILAHLDKEPVPLPELRPDVPAGLWVVVARLLAKCPAYRYQTPAEVAQALTPFCQRGGGIGPVLGTVTAENPGGIAAEAASGILDWPAAVSPPPALPDWLDDVRAATGDNTPPTGSAGPALPSWLTDVRRAEWEIVTPAPPGPKEADEVAAEFLLSEPPGGAEPEPGPAPPQGPPLS
jgi:serine/threonine protein kinase